eukprot:CAMPEP_0172802478 /NCGR_PEP_ID=MMETSP1075-20121228/3925_1 /TAXON_ID=2916 /ORGANISM="Ceratium fusus, Strain PA161109" /LENGTH=33 /DNA_ID= /DNA_START= /DNA_END= /DNA_ORIENTATION=
MTAARPANWRPTRGRHYWICFSSSNSSKAVKQM